ncbi:unnamed protein product [Lymnaea stagnalis]|uniref:Uncharacterized protein n=1 Tax=Lymnaea stagnalis TaxID=6523 RepID=A0AAV2HPT0_LYMST
MRLLIVLLAVPMVLAGDFAKMWAEVEDKIKEKGWGDEKKEELKDVVDKSWGEQEVKGWGEEDLKGWGEEGSKGSGEEKSKGWGDEKAKGWGDEKSKGWGDEKAKGWGDEKAKGWGDEKAKGWGDEKSKGWGDEKSKGWGDEKKSKGWGDEKKSKGWGDDKSKGWGEKKSQGSEDDKKSVDVEQKKVLFEQFKDWLKSQERHDDAQEEYKEYMARNVDKFKEYLKIKEFKENQEKEAKQAIYRQMEKIHMKKMLTEKLTGLTKEYKEQKLHFIFSITGHFLEFCKCDNSRDILERIASGQFGSPDLEVDDSAQLSDTLDIEDFGINGTLAMFNSSIAEYMNNSSKKEEKIKWFASLERAEQVKFVLNEYVTIMCSSAKQLTNVLRHAEPDLVAYNKKLRTGQ